MKKILIYVILSLVAVPLFSQPWLRYMSPSKSAGRLEGYRALKKAFHTYWKNREPADEDEYNTFARWEWMIDQRITDDSYIQPETYWNEILRKEEARKKGELTGDWHYLGPPHPPTDINSGQVIGAGRIDCIAFHPSDSNTFWVGAPTGGLWKTTDGGKTWQPLTDFIASIGISDIAVDPDHPDTMFIATGDRDSRDIYSAGVLKTFDGGKTWSETAMSFVQSSNHQVNRLLIRPDRPNTMLAATDEGIYYITRYGEHIQKVQSGNFKDMEFMPGSPDTVYAATYGYGTATIYRSDDGGSSFHEISSGINTSNLIRIDLAVTRDHPDMVIALCAEKTKSGLHGIYRSFNKGNEWTLLLSGSKKNLLGNSSTGSGDDGQGWYDLTVAISPDNYQEFIVGGINVWKTTNGGSSWQLSSWGYPESGTVDAPYIHVDQHILAFNPATGTLYAGNDGGVFRTWDEGETWTDLSDGLDILQIYRIGLASHKKDMAMMGSQDNSTTLWKDTAWNVVIGGDGMECIIDYTDINTLYASSQYGNIRRSTDGGYIFRGIKPVNAGKGAWVTPYLMFPDDHRSLLAGYADIFLTKNQGNTWEKLTDSLSGGKKFRALAISSYNPHFIYASAGQSIWRSEDRGKTWKSIHTGLPNSSISSIAISQNDPLKIWVSLSNYDQGIKVYASDDGGNHWNNYSDGLPNVPVNCLLYQNNTNATLYAGTDLGVYVRDGSMDTWKDFSLNLPNVIVNEMEIFYPDSLLRAGTYGRGLWETKLFVPDTLALYADFSSNKVQSCAQSPFTFYNRYPGPLDSLIWNFGPDGIPATIKNKDTVQVSFDTPGDKNARLIVFRDGQSDTLSRPDYMKVVSSINVQITTNFGEYYWRGNPADLQAGGADNYMWVSSPGDDTLYGKEIIVYPDTNITWFLYATQGNCADTDTVDITVYPNDNIRYALPLHYGENGPFVNYDATVEDHEPVPPAGDCNTDSTWCDEFSTGKDYLAHSVWFTFIAPAGGTVSIDSKGFDTQIAVYEAASPDSLLAGKYKLLAANDDYHGQDLQYAAAIADLSCLTEGKKYWVQLDGSGGNLMGTFFLYLYDSPLAINDLPANQMQDAFVVYPNPNNGTFSLLFNRAINPDAAMKVFTADGKMIIHIKLPRIAAGQSVPVPATLRNKGFYLIQIITPDRIFNNKIMVR